MSWVVYLNATTAILYMIFILAFTKGWKRLSGSSFSPEVPTKTDFSILIPFRNEAANLPTILRDLALLNYPKSLFEIILINDESSDESIAIITASEYYKSLNINLITSRGGKKKAIAKGIETAKNEYIVSLDADCSFGPDLLNVYDRMLSKSDYKMIVGPVCFSSNESFVGQCMQLEFMSLIASGAGAIGLHKPIMANAANLVFCRKMALEAKTEVYDSEVVSGDDIFLLHYAIKHFGAESIQFAKSPQAIVSTPAPYSISQWISQRLRWTSKAKNYQLNFTSITAMVIFAYNLIILVNFGLAFYDISFLLCFGILLLFKLLIDFPLLKSAGVFFQKPHLIKKIVFLEIIYPFYIVFVGTFGLFSKPKWKERNQ